MASMVTTDVVVLGAGPSGASAAALLHRLGRKVLVLERQSFPRFSIGESLLPQAMGLLEEAGLLRGVVEEGFQHKNGAAFQRGSRYTDFDFRQKSSRGWGSAYQVQRAAFDKQLIDQVAAQGVEVRYQHEVTAFTPGPDGPTVQVKGPDGEYAVKARFALDATGFGRLLPRLLNLESPSGFPVRMAYFTHIEDRIKPGAFDRAKILVGVHPTRVDVWYWLIPFSNGRCSLGVVAEPKLLQHLGGTEQERLRAMVAENPPLAELLKDAVWDTPGNTLNGYSANVKALWGDGYALLGNAGEFLDPVFSSGVTIALKSSSMAAPLVDAQLRGEKVDWDAQYDRPLRRGVEAFRAFVESWYRGGFQDVIFFDKQQPEIRRYICSILAGYAWDLENPYVAEPNRLAVLEEICKAR
jgi:flavin-dependent dehydrogenase